MKLIALNTWGGRAGKEGLLRFFREHADTDIFCLQEIWKGGSHLEDRKDLGFPIENVCYHLGDEIQKVLPAHDVYFRPHYGDWYGLAVFIKKEIPVLEEGELFVYKDRGFYVEGDHGNHARNIQWLTIRAGEAKRVIVNFHGLWNGKGKSDTADRLLQSDHIVDFLRTLPHEAVLAGDFNLLPDTESLRRLEQLPLRNLIKEYGITSTRSRHYAKPEKYADYVLCSPGIAVRDFKALPEEVSDHLPLYLEFN